jgi:hypothetical protein
MKARTNQDDDDDDDDVSWVTRTSSQSLLDLITSSELLLLTSQDAGNLRLSPHANLQMKLDTKTSKDVLEVNNLEN